VTVSELPSALTACRSCGKGGGGAISWAKKKNRTAKKKVIQAGGKGGGRIEQWGSNVKKGEKKRIFQRCLASGALAGETEVDNVMGSPLGLQEK